MAIPANQIIHAEVTAQGFAAAGGSNQKNFANVFHFRRTTTVNPVTKAALEAAFQTNIMVPVLAALNNRFTQTFNLIRWADDALDQAVPFVESGVGGVAGEPASTLDAIYVLLRTGIKGRSYRGNKHFGPLSEADCTTGDVLNAAAITRFAAVVTALGTPFTDSQSNTWVIQVFSRMPPSQLKVNPTVVVANDVVQIALNKRVGRMSRREVKSVY